MCWKIKRKPERDYLLHNTFLWWLKKNHLLPLMDDIPQPPTFYFFKASCKYNNVIKIATVLLLTVYIWTFISKKQTLKQKMGLFWIPALGGNLDWTHTSESLTDSTNSMVSGNSEVFACFSKSPRPGARQQHHLQCKGRLCFVCSGLGVWHT